jgi:beta-xylosidase
MNLKLTFILSGLLFAAGLSKAQTKLTGATHSKTYVSQVWSPNLGNDRYKNPVINADYSDPDVVRVGSDFYLISSSFEDISGLPIVHSKDLVNWEILGYTLLRSRLLNISN